jgi:hypothetical protein
MDRQEALERSQSGEKPEGGYYTSSERITLRNFGLGRITRISSSKFAGSGGGRGRGGAIVPLTRSIDSSALVPTAQSSQIDPNTISSLQKQINSLVARDEQQLALNNNLIGTLQNQFQILQTRVIDLGKQLLEVNKSLTLDTNLEKTKEIQEKNLENRQQEQQYRTDKENLIEKKITSALMAPIKMIGERVQFTLARVMQFFSILFTGWLVDKAIEAFRASSEGNTKKLEDIRNSVLKNLGIVGGILLLLNGGFLRIAAKVGQLSLKVGGFILANTIGRFFGSIVNAGRNMLRGGQKPSAPTAGPSIPPATTGGKPTGTPTSTPGKPSGGKPGGKPAGGLGTGLQTIIEGVQGNWMEAGLGAAAFMPGAPGAIAKGLFWGEQALDLFGKGVIPESNKSDSTTPVSSEKSKPQTKAPQQPPTVQPKTPAIPSSIQTPPPAPILPAPNANPSISPTANMMPKSSDYSISPNTNETNIDPNQPAQFGEISIPVTSVTDKEDSAQSQSTSVSPTSPISSSPSSTPSALPISQPPTPSTSVKLSPAQTQRIPSSTTPISPEPEAKPNVVYMSSGGGQPQMPKIPESSGPASEVPFIPSGNPDNFYLLYSQVSYNVVM